MARTQHLTQAEHVELNFHKKISVIPAEHHEIGSNRDAKLTQDFTSAVKLTDGKETYLIPTPSSDPRDPLNLPKWRKILLLICVSLFGTIGLSIVGGLGGLFGFLIPEYLSQGKTVADITHLLTYPTLFMGLGNLISMPLAIAVGRRPVFLASSLLMVVAGVLCITQKNYEWHLAGRIIMGLAAGQAEALCPLIVEETHFLHERGHYLMLYTAMTNILVAVYNLLASYIGAAVGVSGWYAIGTGVAALVFIMAIFFMPESRYYRSLDSYQGQVAFVTHLSHEEDGKTEVEQAPVRYTTTDIRHLDHVNYLPRTFWSDIRILDGPPNWQDGWKTIVAMFQVFFFPDIFWAFILNGFTLGVNIAIQTTYSNVLSAPPYSWEQKNISLAVSGQIVVSLIALPLLGRGSDSLIKWLSRRNNGIHRPEFRLPPLIFPSIVSILCCILYGQAAAHPDRFHWFAIVFAINGFFFGFVAASQVAMVYALDNYPTRAGPSLVIICAMRGIFSFGTSYSIQPFIELRGYSNAFLIYGVVFAVLSGIGIPVYLCAGKIRSLTSRWI